MKKQYNSIDLFKFIYAIIVVMIHTTPFMDISETVSWYFNSIIGNIAVPFFFSVSGFLFFENWEELDISDKRKKLKKYILHILRMYIIWSIIFLPWKLLYINNTGWSFNSIIKYIWEFIFVSSGDALWYLPALLFSIFILCNLKERINDFMIIIIAAAFYIAGVFISSWYQLFDNISAINIYYEIFHTTNNGLFKGLIFTAVGMLVAQKKEKTNGILMIIIMFTANTLETIVIRVCGRNMDNEANTFMMPLLTYFLLISILNIKCKGDIFIRLRYYSICIYLVHCSFIRLLRMIIAAFDYRLSNNSMMFITVLICSILFAKVVYCLSVKKNIKFLKILY